ncbi:MAG: hypothetical protein PHT54_03410 [Candidatus Nanoarchaeia archaeon]|nr:hypothetical protein [Candidatus Nanoarchaeia archaeon]
MVAKKLLQTNIPRKAGKLYFLKGSPLALYEVDMKRGGTKKKAKKRKR